ncbi:hypothetical protein LXL04_035521 [Taraxacum kok-saghyz]
MLPPRRNIPSLSSTWSWVWNFLIIHIDLNTFLRCPLDTQIDNDEVFVDNNEEENKKEPTNLGPVVGNSLKMFIWMKFDMDSAISTNQYSMPTNIKLSYAEDLSKIVTTFYVCNLPGEWNSNRLWKAFEGQGRLVDAFVQGKRDVFGRLFGFVRFIRVSNMHGFLRRLNELSFEGKRIYVNVARHIRAKVSREGMEEKVRPTSQMSRSQGTGCGKKRFARNVSGPTFKEVLQGGNNSKDLGCKVIYSDMVGDTLVIPGEVNIRKLKWLSCCLVGELKDIDLLAKCMAVIHAYGLGECTIRYLGGLAILLQFNNEAMTNCFLTNQKVNWAVWFDWLKAWDGSFIQEKRVVWLKIMGVPPTCWDSVVFSHIAERCGKVVIPFDCPEDARDMLYGRVCVITSRDEHLPLRRIEVKWKDVRFTVNVKEDGDWRPATYVSKSCSDSEDDSVMDGCSGEEEGDTPEDQIFGRKIKMIMGSSTREETFAEGNFVDNTPVKGDAGGPSEPCDKCGPSEPCDKCGPILIQPVGPITTPVTIPDLNGPISDPNLIPVLDQLGGTEAGAQTEK